MRDSQLSSACLATSLLVLSWFSASAALANNVEDATAALRACVEQAIPDEKKKSKPNVDKLLRACESELDAVLELIPGALRRDIKHEIRHQTDDKLKKGNKAG